MAARKGENVAKYNDESFGWHLNGIPRASQWIKPREIVGVLGLKRDTTELNFAPPCGTARVWLQHNYISNNWYAMHLNYTWKARQIKQRFKNKNKTKSQRKLETKNILYRIFDVVLIYPTALNRMKRKKYKRIIIIRFSDDKLLSGKQMNNVSDLARAILAIGHHTLLANQLLFRACFQKRTNYLMKNHRIYWIFG